MVRAGGADHLVVQRLVAAALDQLLKLRLIVPAALLHGLLLLLVQQHPVDQGPGGFHAAVQVHRREHGLRCVGQDGGPLTAAAGLLALAQPQLTAQAQALGHLIQALLAHQRRPHPGQVSLRQVRVLVIQIVRRDQTQHGVPQKLQPLVAADAAAPVLVGVGAVVQGRLKLLLAAEGVAQLFFQYLQGMHDVFSPFRSGKRKPRCNQRGLLFQLLD